ncbi:MAG: hypothetical protein AAFX99_34210 [Myxococcota bacterium]
MTRPGQSFREAWEIFIHEPLPWIALGAVFLLVGSVIPIFGGFLLLPNVVRETLAALEEERSPQVAGLFNLEHLPGDAASMGLYMIAQTVVGLLTCMIGWPLAWLGLWYSVELQAERRVSVLGSLRIALLWALHHPLDVITMGFGTLLINAVGASLGVGFGIALSAPIGFIAWAIHWRSIRSEVYTLAQSRGLEVAAPLDTKSL